MAQLSIMKGIDINVMSIFICTLKQHQKISNFHSSYTLSSSLSDASMISGKSEASSMVVLQFLTP